jgi:2',3'-cyclic-nucleotide 2'-phosphodiesterase (5'-nucleotidase family)
VGFLGLTAPRVASYPQAVGWKIMDPIATAIRWIPIARRNCDILIAVTHIGVDLDKQLAAETTGLDAIVGGDSHTFLYKAVEVNNPEGKKIPIVQDGEFGVNLGRFDLRFTRASDGHWSLADYTYQLLPVDALTKEAPDVVAALQRYLQPMLKVVGHIPAVGATPAERDTITNRIVVDALRLQTGSDFALNPGDSGFEVFRHKEVTLYDVCAILPFKNHIVTATLTGAEITRLTKLVETTVVSGDLKQIDPNRTYKVALVDYAAKSEYRIDRNKLVDTAINARDAVVAYLGTMR